MHRQPFQPGFRNGASANFTNRLFRSKRRFQRDRPNADIEALTVQHVGLCVRGRVDMLPLTNALPTRFQNLKRGIQYTLVESPPCHASLLHPIGQSVQILCKGGKRDRVRFPVGRFAKISVAPISIPPAYGSHLQKLRSSFRAPWLISLVELREPGVQKGKSFNRHALRVTKGARAWNQTP